MSDGPVIQGITTRQRYESLVTAFYQDVYRYAFWLCKNPSRAEDLVQETFLRAWRSMDSLQSDAAAKAWLFTILRRENARYYERYSPTLVELETTPIPASRDDEPETGMDRELLSRAIDRLGSDYREPLLLQIIGGFSGKQIGQILGLNSNTVMTRLFRARNQLKQAFEAGAAEEAADE